MFLFEFQLFDMDISTFLFGGYQRWCIDRSYKKVDPFNLRTYFENSARLRSLAKRFKFFLKSEQGVRRTRWCPRVHESVSGVEVNRLDELCAAANGAHMGDDTQGYARSRWRIGRGNLHLKGISNRRESVVAAVGGVRVSPAK